MYFVFADPNLEISPPTVKVLPPSSNECRSKKDRKKKKTLVCVATDFYPDHVTVKWKKNGQQVIDNVATDPAALFNGKKYSITSRLRVSGTDWFISDNEFTCIVSFYNGTVNENYTASISGMFIWNSEMTEMFCNKYMYMIIYPCLIHVYSSIR